MKKEHYQKENTHGYVFMPGSSFGRRQIFNWISIQKWKGRNALTQGKPVKSHRQRSSLPGTHSCTWLVLRWVTFMLVSLIHSMSAYYSFSFCCLPACLPEKPPPRTQYFGEDTRSPAPSYSLIPFSASFSNLSLSLYNSLLITQTTLFQGPIAKLKLIGTEEEEETQLKGTEKYF